MSKYAGADWLQGRVDFELSPLARKVADLMGQVECGLYHWDCVVGQKGWNEKYLIELRYGDRLTTHSFPCSLTLLVLLCHQQKIELTIEPCSDHQIRLLFVESPEMLDILKFINQSASTLDAIAPDNQPNNLLEATP